MRFLEDPIRYHKEHHTIFMIVENSIMWFISFFLCFLTKKETYTMNLDGNVLSYEEYIFGTEHFSFLYVLPVILILLQLAFAFFIIYVRDKKGNPILAKKYSHGLFYVSVVFSVVDLLLTFIFSHQVNELNPALFVEYNHSLSFIITTVFQILNTLNYYVWRSEFGLEKFYGSR